MSDTYCFAIWEPPFLKYDTEYKFIMCQILEIVKCDFYAKLHGEG